MTLQELHEYMASHYGAESDHPIKEEHSITVFMRPDNKKWFAATKNIGCKSLGIDRAGRIDILNVKLDPRVVATLRVREGFMPAWYMNQNSWVTILLDGSVADEEIREYLDMAYALAGDKRGKR
ncbi:MAG: MmcQ/YjbR family DNA-binding protein [Atopobiaceae bacterium]|nr:MmcQ/YjbR family DNA-binding protein [Atopobiaceae bacterium]